MACFAYNLILEMTGLSLQPDITPGVILLSAEVQYSLSSSVVLQVLVCKHDSISSEFHGMYVASRMTFDGDNGIQIIFCGCRLV